VSSGGRLSKRWDEEHNGQRKKKVERKEKKYELNKEKKESTKSGALPRQRAQQSSSNPFSVISSTRNGSK
jgi:hypothetical protein